MTLEALAIVGLLVVLLLRLSSLPGVEPEPFEIGDHLIEASGKLCLLDKLLSFLYAGYVVLLSFTCGSLDKPCWEKQTNLSMTVTHIHQEMNTVVVQLIDAELLTALQK